MVSGGGVEVVIRKAPWTFQDLLAGAVAWVPAVSELASDVFEGLTADGMEILLCASACHGTSCGLSGEREGGGPGSADWECFPFPVSLHPLELSAGNSSSGLRSRAQRPVRRTSADAPPWPADSGQGGQLALCRFALFLAGTCRPPSLIMRDTSSAGPGPPKRCPRKP